MSFVFSYYSCLNSQEFFIFLNIVKGCLFFHHGKRRCGVFVKNKMRQGYFRIIEM
jgi:hypothetical protein